MRVVTSAWRALAPGVSRGVRVLKDLRGWLVARSNR